MLGQLGRQLAAIYRGLSTGKKVALALMVAMSVGGLSLMVHLANKPDYQLLFSNISPEDAGAIIGKLKEQRVPYKVTGAGRTVLVPSETVDELRLQLASQGIPRGEGTGFELFDKSSPWSTGFVQELNYQRALQGELARSIGSLAEVEWARVHLVVPRESLFVEDRKESTASVVLKIRSGASLNRSQIGGIVHLVAGSVEGLKPEKVAVIDNYGNILSGQQDQGIGGQFTVAQLEARQKIEQDLQKGLQVMLDKALGKGRSAVNVSMELDFRKVERTEEKYEPENAAVRSEQKASENSNKAGAGGTDTQGDGNSNYQKKNEAVNYEVGKVVNHIVEPVGSIKRQHLAVLIDGRYETAPDGSAKYIPRTDEEMEIYGNLLKKASGFNEERGDQIEIANVRFDSPSLKEPGEEQGAPAIDKFKVFSMIGQKYLLKVVLLLLVFLFMVRPLYKWFLLQPRPVANRGQQMDIPGQIEGEDDFRLELQGKQEGKALPPKDRALEIVRADPNRAAAVARKWLNEER